MVAVRSDGGRYLGLEHVAARTTKILGSGDGTDIKGTGVNFQAGDTLYARLRPYLNKVCAPDFGGMASGEFIVLPAADWLAPKFLMYFLNQPDVVAFANARSTGTHRPRISWEELSGYPILLPPIREQHRIVAAIEEQISRIDAGVGALQRARRNLQRMRAAVLQAAVTGRLVPQDLNDKPADAALRLLLEEMPEAREYECDTSAPALPELPPGWAWVSVGQIGEVVTGRTPDTRRADYFGPGLPFVTPGDLGEDLIVRAATRELTEAGATQVRRLPANSVLVTCIGATIGKVGLAITPCASNQQINAVIPLDTYAQPRWLCYAMASPWFFGLLRSEASSTTMPILNKSRFRALPIPLPPFGEQKRIVIEVERHLSVLDGLNARVSTSTRRAEQLRRAVLDNAFAGRLVNQDPSDEPAEVLLGHIKSARAGSVPGPSFWRRSRG
jgi:type I restriction enzyme S subunit